MLKRGWGAVTAIVVLVFTTGIFLSSRLSREERGPVARPNPAQEPPVVRNTDGVLHVQTTAPAELLVPDSVPPDRRDVQLLWFEGRTAVPSAEGRVVLDAAGAPLVFDGRLVAWRLPWQLEGHEPASVAADAAGGFWVATRAGALVRVDAGGRLADSTAAPYDYSWVTADATGRVWAFRSPQQFSFPFGQPVAPLVTPVKHDVAPPVPARMPANPLFVHLVNAGRVVPADDGGFFYAPFIREEIIRFGPTGDTVWVASRGLTHGVAEPSIELGPDGRPVLDYAPVNLGLQLGPDGMLYVLSTPGHTVERARLDRVDPDSGIVRATVLLPTALPTLAVDPAGRVYLLDPFRLLTGVAPAEREEFRAFRLEALRGGEVTARQFRGKVLLVNFWASWCAPCREEMPALDTLRREFSPDSFAFIAISDDINPDAARAFIDEYGFAFPVPLGKGKMRNQYHYVGLPFTVLVDAEGRVVQRWAGYGGPPQVQSLRQLIRAELDRMSGASAGAGSEHAGHGSH